MKKNDILIVSNKKYGFNIAMLGFGRLASILGTNVFNFALSLYILDITGSAAAFSTIISLSIIPGLLINLLAGAFVDRHDKKKLMVSTDILSGMIVLCFVVVFGYAHNALWLFGVYVVIVGSIQAVFGLSVNASVPQIAESKDVHKVNSMLQAISSVVSIIGPIIGALLYKSIGLKPLMISNGILLIVSGIFEIFIIFKKITNNDEELLKRRYLDDVKITFKYLRDKKSIVFFLVFAAVADFFIIPMISLVLPYITYNILKVSGLQLSLIQSSCAAGTILGAITISFLKSNNYYMKKFFSLFRVQAILIVCWIIPKLPIFPNDSKWILTLVFSIVLMAFGIFNTMQNIPMITHFQLSIPDNLRARIFGVFASALFITSPLGIWLYGILMEFVDWSIITVVSGVILLVIGFIFVNNKNYREFCKELTDETCKEGE